MLARGAGGAGGVRPAPIRQIGTVGARNRFAGGDRRTVGLDELTATHQRQRASVTGVVDAQVVVRIGLGAQLDQQTLGLLDAARHGLGPRPCGECLAALGGGRPPAPIDQLERRAGALEHGPRDADRAVRGARLAQPRAREHERVASVEQRQRPAERGLRLVAAAPPRLELADLEPHVGAIGSDRERFLEVSDRLVERRDRTGVGRPRARAPGPLRHRPARGGDDGPPRPDAGSRPRVRRPAASAPTGGEARAGAARRSPRTRRRAGARGETRCRRRPPAAGRTGARRVAASSGSASGSRPSSTASIGLAATAASSTSSRASASSGASVARTEPRRLGATSSRPRPSARAVSTASSALPSDRSTTRSTSASLRRAALRASAATAGFQGTHHTVMATDAPPSPFAYLSLTSR